MSKLNTNLFDSWTFNERYCVHVANFIRASQSMYPKREIRNINSVQRLRLKSLKN